MCVLCLTKTVAKEQLKAPLYKYHNAKYYLSRCYFRVISSALSLLCGVLFYNLILPPSCPSRPSLEPLGGTQELSGRYSQISEHYCAYSECVESLVVLHCM